MANTAVIAKPLEIVNQMITFNGDNPDEFIEDLRNASEIIRDVDGALFIKSVIWKKIKPKNLVIGKETCTKIEQIIKAVRAYCPITESALSLFRNLSSETQDPSENMQQFADRMQGIMHKIEELKKEEVGLSSDALKLFIETMKDEAAKYFKTGVKKEIRYELENLRDFNEIVSRAKQIGMLNKSRDIPTQISSKSVFLAKEDQFSEIQVFTCQICKEKNHEALFCKIAACVYCKESGHISNNCV